MPVFAGSLNRSFKRALGCLRGCGPAKARARGVVTFSPEAYP
jgi:hypothetical protein